MAGLPERRPAARPRWRSCGAGISLRDRWRVAGTVPGTGTPAGSPLGPATRPAPAAGRRRTGAPPGRLLLGRAARGWRGSAGPGRRAGPVAGRRRPDPEREDHEPGRAGHPRLARPGAGGQRQERPPAPHAGDAGAPRPGLVHRPDGRARGPGPAPGRRSRACGRVARGVPGRRPLCEAAKGDGTTADGEFWYATAAKLLAPLFLAAALDGRSMADVVRWVDTQEVGEVADILERAGARPRRSTPPRRPGAATTAPAAPSTRRPRPCSPRSPIRRPVQPARRHLRARPSARRRPHAVPVRARPRPAPAARLLHRADPAGAVARLRLRHEVGPAARPAAARRARRGGAHRPAARARRAGRDLRVARDPDRHGLAGPGPGQGPLRRAGADGAQQPPGQAVPARHRRPRHARVRQPARRRRGGHPAVGDARPDGPALDDVDDEPAPAAAARGAPLPAAGRGGTRLRDAAAGAAAAAAVVGARTGEVEAQAGPDP